MQQACDQEQDRRLNWREACEILRCSKSSLYRMIYEGRLPAYGVGRRNRYILKSDCERLLAENVLFQD